MAAIPQNLKILKEILIRPIEQHNLVIRIEKYAVLAVKVITLRK